MNVKHVLVLLFACLFFVSYNAVKADPLSYVSDLISTSAPSAEATHTIQFTATQAIPASGKIVVSFPEGNFSIPANLDYLDIDLAVATSASASYVDRSLAAVASASDDGVAVVTGTGGSITFTLNSSSGIAAGEYVQIQVGSIATYGGTGTHAITNASATGSYRIRIYSRDPADTQIDYGTAMVAMVSPVTVTNSVVIVAPTRSNGLPSGTVSSPNGEVEISLNTSVSAYCRYATTTGVSYASMTGTFDPSDLSTIHWINLTGFVHDTTYSFYVRCAEIQDVANDDDYEITFTLGSSPAYPTSGPSFDTGSNGTGGFGDYLGGSQVLYLASVSFSGASSPQSTINVLVNGVRKTSVQAGTDGSFHATLSDLERGVYTFQVYGVDGRGEKSNTFSSTMTLNSGSTNAISGITLKFSTSTSVTQTSSGSAGDVNGDGKTNLVDFSILLSSWGTSEPSVDFNQDGTVNLADFSILLYNWTG